MFNNPRKIILWLGCLLLLVGAFVAWRAMHPPLTDKQQIEAQIEESRLAVEQKNSGGVVRYLAKDFKWQDMKRGELKSNIGAALLQMHNPQFTIPALNTQVQGDTATSTGRYHLSYQGSEGTTPQTQSGDFKLHWAKRDGEWQVTQIEGGMPAGME